MNYKVTLNWDNEAKVWYALSDDVPGLALESPSYDKLIDRVKSAVTELLELNNIIDPNISINFTSERLEKVA